jgi:hypothetical protein
LGGNPSHSKLIDIAVGSVTLYQEASLKTKKNALIQLKTTLFQDFFARIARGEIVIYNEFSLQHELGIYLRNQNNQYAVQFERPVSFFGLRRTDFEKKEIDLAIFTRDFVSKCAVELKYPRNGQHPEQMFKACQDICFLEQLVQFGFASGLFIMVADDPLFYNQIGGAGIYQYFRAGVSLTGSIVKPTGAKDHTVRLQGRYTVQWNQVTAKMKYFLIEVNNSNLGRDSVNRYQK